MKRQVRKIAVLLGLLHSFPAFSDAYHNINGFFGERAAGLGGAYTAVSDDPSGAFYNPAGLNLAYDNSISLSASNYTKVKKTYENALGPAQGYGRTNQNYIPNFFGMVKEVGAGKFAFSVVNPIQENYQRNDQIRLPLFYPDISNIKSYNRETYNQLLVGASYSRPITSKLSWGATLYYVNDTASITSTQLTMFKNKQYAMQTINDNRRTTGLLPVLGLMFNLTDKISLGASLRRTFVMGQNRLINAITMDSSSTSTDGITFLEGTQKAFGASVGNTIYKGPAYTGRVPETYELRLGGAFFPTKKLMIATDLIYTSGYSFKKNNTEVITSPSANIIILTDKDDLELKRYQTWNIATGVEYFLTDFLALRLGVYTNNANTKKIDWMTSALQAYNRAAGDTETIASSGGNSVQFRIPTLRDNPRNEYVNTMGYSFGFSFATAKAALSLSIIKEHGKGAAQLDSMRPAQQLTYDASSIYLVITSRSN